MPGTHTWPWKWVRARDRISTLSFPYFLMLEQVYYITYLYTMALYLFFLKYIFDNRAFSSSLGHPGVVGITSEHSLSIFRLIPMYFLIYLYILNR